MIIQYWDGLTPSQGEHISSQYHPWIRVGLSLILDGRFKLPDISKCSYLCLGALARGEVEFCLKLESAGVLSEEEAQEGGHRLASSVRSWKSAIGT